MLVNYMTKFLIVFHYLQLNPSPLLTQNEYDNDMCDETLFEKNNIDCTNRLCQCPYVLKVTNTHYLLIHTYWNNFLQITFEKYVMVIGWQRRCCWNIFNFWRFERCRKPSYWFNWCYPCARSFFLCDGTGETWHSKREYWFYVQCTEREFKRLRIIKYQCHKIIYKM